MIKTLFTVVKCVFSVYLGLSYCAGYNTFFPGVIEKLQ